MTVCTFDKPTPCATVDPNIFFPVKGGSARKAREICAGCYMKDQCAAEAVAAGRNIIGIWGGTTDDDRRKIRRKAHK